MQKTNCRWFLFICFGKTLNVLLALINSSKVEIKQRWDISGPLHPDIDMSLERYMPELKVKFGRNWGEHRCKKPGYLGSFCVIL